MWRRTLRDNLLTILEESATLCCPRFRHHQVHPIVTQQFPHVEMVQVGTKRTIRVLHHVPENKQKTSKYDSKVGRDATTTEIATTEQLAEHLIQQALKDAFTHFRNELHLILPQNGGSEYLGFVNPCFIEEIPPIEPDHSDVTESQSLNESQSASESSIWSTWGSTMEKSMRFKRMTLPSFNGKPLIFFIHGVGTSADIWTIQMAYFKKRGYETVAIDLIGHGFSSAPYKSKYYKFQRILEDVTTIFDKYSLEQNVIIGHSYGSSLAAALTQRRLCKVSRLILMSGGGPIGLRPREDGFTWMKCLKTCVQPLDYCGLYSRELFYCPSSREITIPSTYEVPSYVLRHLINGQTWPEGNTSFYRSITIQTLLIHGLKDPYVTLVEECEMEKAIPRSVLELIPNASHMIMLDESHHVNKLIYHFIQ